MISDHDRSGWFGASDTAKVMGKWKGTSFQEWWHIKLGDWKSDLDNIYLRAGNAYEGKILDAIGCTQRDRQLRFPEILLRVNLDGEDERTVYEVKTHKTAPFTVSKAYWMQAQVEMFATGKKLKLVSYHLLPEDYEDFDREIDPDRLKLTPVEYDPKWIETEYMPRLKYLAEKLRNKLWPLEWGKHESEIDWFELCD